VGTVEERVAAAEARVGEHSIMLDAIRQSVDRLDQRMTAMDSRIDQRFTALEVRLDQRFAQIDQRFLAIDGRFDALDAKMSRQFQFLVSIQVTMFVALSGAMIAGFFALR
jgi:hypothetical protein